MYGLSQCFPKREASLLTCGVWTLDYRVGASIKNLHQTPLGYKSCLRFYNRGSQLLFFQIHFFFFFFFWVGFFWVVSVGFNELTTETHSMSHQIPAQNLSLLFFEPRIQEHHRWAHLALSCRQTWITDMMT